MTPVRRRDLVVVTVGLALATWLVVRSVYGDLPPLRWWLPVPLALLAVAEALAARALTIRLDAVREARRSARGGGAEAPAAGRSGLVRPVDPLLVARVAVLAQASAYVGAAFAGVWVGVLLHVVPSLDRLDAAADDAVPGVIGVVASSALALAALWLEHVCRVPPGEDDDAGPAGRVRA